MRHPPIYEADRTGRIQYAGGIGPGEEFELKIHELGDDGQPICGQRAKRWHNKPMVLMPLRQGPVSCEQCAKITGHN